jgi:citrate synthase
MAQQNDGNNAVTTCDVVVNGEKISLNALSPVMGRPTLDIAPLGKAGYNVYDPGFTYTAMCKSAVTFVDGDNGILLYRGYPVQDIVHNYSFLETAYLVIHGEFPDAEQMSAFRESTDDISIATSPAVDRLFEALPAGTHPMAIISSVISAVSGMLPQDGNASLEAAERLGAQFIGAMPLLVARAFRASEGRPHAAVSPTGQYVQDFLSMCFSGTDNELFRDPLVISSLESLLTLHADHELNCSTATLRLVGSAQASFPAAVSAAVCALWGPLHGGANQAVIKMLNQIHQDNDDVGKYVARAKDPSDPFRLMGFGHRVYKTFDARAKVIREMAVELVAKTAGNDPLLDLAFQLEEVAVKDDFFVSRHLYPNVDFYSGIIYQIIGFPPEMFTPLFVLGRTPGWVAHWLELIQDPSRRIGRPAQVYEGHAARPVPPRSGGNG